MSIHRLLVPVTGHERDRTVLQTAIVISKSLNAHIDALFARGEATEFVPVMGEGYSGLIAQDIIDAVEKAAKERAEAAKKTSAEMAGLGEIPMVEHQELSRPPSLAFYEKRGPLLAALHDESQLTDLIVFAHQSAPLSVELKSIMPDLLINCRRPILVVPEEAPESVGKRILIGWDGSEEAAAALRQARGFYRSAESVTLVAVSNDEQAARESLAGPLAYLGYHGVKAESCIDGADRKDAGERLLAIAADLKADLVVVGGYGHSRVREFIFGGATRKLLNDATIPVFMAH